jgi:hypothetical protein
LVAVAPGRRSGQKSKQEEASTPDTQVVKKRTLSDLKKETVLEIDHWITENSMSEGKRNLTAKELGHHIEATYQVKVLLSVCDDIKLLTFRQCTEADAKNVFKRLKFRYATVQAGDYAVKAGLATTLAHRELMLPLLDFWMSSKDFAVFYHDEVNMTVNLSQPKAWVKKGERPVDFRKKSGAGLGKLGCCLCFVLSFCFVEGVGVSAFLDATSRSILQRIKEKQRFDEGEISGAIVKRQQKRSKVNDEDEDDDEGAAIQSQSKKRRVAKSIVDEAKDTSEKFIKILENAIDDAQAKYPDKTPVFVVDGGGPHTVEPSTTIRCSAMSLEEIKEELRRSGKCDGIDSCTNTELRTRYINSNIALNQWTIAELTCLQKGALLLYLPLNHPGLNN